MKIRFSIISILFLFTSISANACEICGCGNSNFQIGLLPNFNKGFLGLRYGYSHFNSQLKTDATQYSNDYYQTFELWGGYNFKKLQVMTFLPYVTSRKESDDGVTVSNGIGDIMLLVNYKIFTSAHLSENEKIAMKHELYFGGGLKLPTGVNHVDTSNPDFNIGDFNSQAGTGSVDYIVNTTYNLAWNKSGIVTNVAYRINTANNQNYKFGNRTYLNTVYYYTFTKSATKFKPNVGLNYQSNTVNKFQGTEVESSNGYNLNSTIGLNVIRNKFGVNAMAFIPLAQNMYDGQTKLQSRFLFGLTYSF